MTGGGDRFFVKLYKDQSLDWLALSGLTRGLYAELLLLADRRGHIRLGRLGLAALEVPLRAPWGELEPHVSALVEIGRVVVQGDTLALVDFEIDQPRAKTDAERARDYRDAKRASRGTDESHDASRVSVTRRDASGEAQERAPGDVSPGSSTDTSPPRESEGAQDLGPPSRTVTGRHDVSPYRKKEEIGSDQTDQTEEAEARAPAAAAPEDPVAQAFFEKLSSLPPLDGIATPHRAEALAGIAMSAGKATADVLRALEELAQKQAARVEANDPRDPPWTTAELISKSDAFVRRAGPLRSAAGSGVARAGHLATVAPGATAAEIEAAQRANGVQVGTRDWSRDALVVNDAGELVPSEALP